MSEAFELNQAYFPGAKLRLILRLEEYGDAAKKNKILDPSKVKPPHIRKGVLDADAQLSYTPDPSAPPGVTRFLLVAKGQGTAPQGDHTQAETSSDGLTQVVGAVIPHSAKLGRTGWKQGDTLDVAFRYADLPVDPRVFRACAVEFYLGTVSQEEFSAGVSGGTRGFVRGQRLDAEPLQTIPDDWFDTQNKLRSNLRFQGWVDEWEWSWTGEQQAVVHLRCVDNTRLLIDQEMSPLLTIDGQKPVDEAVAQLLANFPQMQGIGVEYRPSLTRSSIPTVGASLGPAAFRPDLGGPGSAKNSGSPVGRMSLWEFIVEVVQLIGHSARLEGTTLVIQRVRTATSRAFPPRQADPFQGYTWGGSKHVLRTFVWGRNVMTARGGRKYTHHSRRNVEVRCYDPEHKITLVARHPQSPAKRAVHALPGDGRAETKYVVVTVAGVNDKKTLQKIAQHYYEGLNRAETYVTFTTRNLASFGGTNADPDLLDLLAGDRFEFLVDPAILIGNDSSGATINDFENKLINESVGLDLLTGAGLSSDFALAYLAVYSSKDFQTEYVTRAIQYSWDRDKGLDVEIEGVNFIEVALDDDSGFDDSDVLPTAGQQTKKKQQPGGP